MSFGEQMVHIAQANYGYCAFIADTKSPYGEPAKNAKVEKAAAIKDLGGSLSPWGSCATPLLVDATDDSMIAVVFDGLEESKLSQMHGEGKGIFSTMDVMLGVMIHMTHHRGQAEVYLRLKGITPPEYKW